MRYSGKCNTGSANKASWDDAGMVASAGALRKPFVRYWLSDFLGNFGDGVRLAAFPLLAAQLTRSPTAVAAVTAVQSLPWLLGPAPGSARRAGVASAPLRDQGPHRHGRGHQRHGRCLVRGTRLVRHRSLHQRPAVYGVLLAVGAIGGIVAGAAGARLTRRLGAWGRVSLSR
jgi:hypothetical protein